MLRAVVVGAGNMGRHHVRILGGMSGVTLTAVIDPDEQRAQTTLARAATRTDEEGPAVHADITELSESATVDLAVVASPTTLHVEHALRLIERGASVLVEKPLAETPERARMIVDAARDAGVVLAVGHVERFNAAVSVLQGMAATPKLLSFERLSPFTPRIKDSVVFDLMIHDLDLASWIVGEHPIRVQAAGTRVFSESLDIASAILEFPGGAIATLQASRATQDKVRRISLSEPDRFIVADSVRQDVSIKREASVEYAEETRVLYRQASIMEVPYLDRSGEPLVRELEDFVAAVRTRAEGGAAAPLVSGEDGLAAVELAAQVERAAGI